MASIDFYTLKEDIRGLVQFLFEETEVRVFESHSEFDKELREFRSFDELLAAFDLGSDKHGHGSAVLLQLWSAVVMPTVEFEQIALKVPGHSFRYCISGVGLIQFYHGGLMYMKPRSSQLPATDIESPIVTAREHRVILAPDLAAIYSVPTKALNQAVKRNADKFPTDFMFRLTLAEAEGIRRSRSQFVTLKRGQNIKYLPSAFTEHGAIMAANDLNSPRATQMSVFVVRTFVKMREDVAANAAILKRLAEIDKTLLIHDAGLRDIYEKLRPLLEPPPAPPKPEIGFHVKEAPIPYRIKRTAARSAGRTASLKPGKLVL